MAKTAELSLLCDGKSEFVSRKEYGERLRLAVSRVLVIEADKKV